MTDTLRIDTGSTEPIYQQLAEQMRRRIAAGLWRAGDEVPSVREIAQSLAVNPMTVSKSLSLLEAEGWLDRRRGLSMVVAAQHRRALPVADRLERLRPTLERAVSEVRDLELTPAQALRLFQHLLEEAPQ